MMAPIEAEASRMASDLAQLLPMAVANQRQTWSRKVVQHTNHKVPLPQPSPLQGICILSNQLPHLAPRILVRRIQCGLIDAPNHQIVVFAAEDILRPIESCFLEELRELVDGDALIHSVCKSQSSEDITGSSYTYLSRMP